MRSLTRTMQTLKLALAELTTVETSLRVTKEEAQAMGAYLLAVARGEAAEFRLRERRLWRAVVAVYERAPVDYIFGIGEIEEGRYGGNGNGRNGGG